MIRFLAVATTFVFSASAPCQEGGFTVAEAPWNVEFQMASAQVQMRNIKPGGKSAYFLLTRGDGLSISFFIEPVKDCGDAMACRDRVWQSLQPKLQGPEQVSLSRMGDAYVIEFLLPKVGGAPVRQQNLYAEFVADGYWVDFHLSKGDYKPEDHSLFTDFVGSISFVSKP
jgi:hypothetical protein